MSNVTLHIGGRSFTVACAAGEEAHVAELGREIDDKLASMGDMSGQSESRMLLFAALLLADALHEARGSGAPASEEGSDRLAERLAAIADSLEKLAESLESGSASA